MILAFGVYCGVGQVWLERLTFKMVPRPERPLGAHEIMTEHKYNYTMSAVIAYIEWFEMVDMDRTKH